MSNIEIQYKFSLLNGEVKYFLLKFDENTFDLIQEIPANLPQWTKLDFLQCSNCTLTVETTPYCPLAASLVTIVKDLGSMLSHEEIHLEVITEERKLEQNTTAQRGICSLMGLISATC